MDYPVRINNYAYLAIGRIYFVIRKNLIRKDGNCMKNYFLYVDYNNKIVDTMSEAIYMFDNRRIVAVDRQTYDKDRRLKLQNELNIRPYYITQEVFKEMLYHFYINPNKVIIRDINFIDDFIEETDEYEQLEAFITKRNIEGINNYVRKIIKEYDTEIYDIKIRYQGYDFSITNQGVLNVEAPDDTFKKFLKDNDFCRLINL